MQAAQPSTIALAIRLGSTPGDTDVRQAIPTLSHSEDLNLDAQSNRSDVSQALAGSSAPNVDGHVDGLQERPNSPTGTHRLRSERLLTVRQVAERLSVSRATVYTLVSRGTLPHVRISNAIRVNEASLESFWARRAPT